MLLNLLKAKILILDGAMSTQIQAITSYNAKGSANWHKHTDNISQNNYDAISLTNPSLIKSIHLDYLRAGADIITTNTFRANALAQQHFGSDGIIEKINSAAVNLAKDAISEYHKTTPYAKGPHFIAGSIGPVNRSTANESNGHTKLCGITPEAIYAAYKEQIHALIKSGVDLLILETVINTTDALMMLEVIKQCSHDCNVAIPVIVSATISQQTGQTYDGFSIGEFIVKIGGSESLIAIGLNCSFGFSAMIPFIEELSHSCPIFTCIYPNAGLPDEDLNYPDTPFFFANKAKEAAEKGYINIIGGCCGTTSAHIKEIANQIKDIPPRKPIIKKFAASSRTQVTNYTEGSNLTRSVTHENGDNR